MMSRSCMEEAFSFSKRDGVKSNGICSTFPRVGRGSDGCQIDAKKIGTGTQTLGVANNYTDADHDRRGDPEPQQQECIDRGGRPLLGQGGRLYGELTPRLLSMNFPGRRFVA